MALYEYYTADSLNDGIGISYWACQTFSPLLSHFITKVKLGLRKGSGGTLTVSIRATSGGVPTGGDLCYGTTDANTLPSGSTELREIVFNTPVFLAAGTTYAIVVRSSTNYNYWRWVNSGGAYPRGQPYYSTNSGSTWPYSYPNAERYFQDWDGIFETDEAINILKDSAEGQVVVKDGTDITEIGIDWGIESGVYTGEATQSGSFPAATYQLDMTDLNPVTVYYFRSKVNTGAHGWLYDGELDFQTAHDDDWYLFENLLTGGSITFTFYSTNWLAMTFTPTSSHTIRSVKMLLYRTGSSGSLTASIRAVDGSGHPTGADLCSGNLPQSYLSTGSTWHEIGLGDGTLLIAGTKYAIVLRTSGGNASNNCKWSCGTGLYSGGVAEYSTNSGSSWATQTVDCLFGEYGDSGVLTFPATNIGALEAQGNGFLVNTDNINEIGFEWGIVEGGPYPDEVTDTVTPFFAGDYSLMMTGLSGTTVYYYRAKCYNTALGTWLYGNEESFTTLPPTPTVRTLPPSGATANSIDAEGEILYIGAENADRRGFVYSLTTHDRPFSSTDPGDSGYENYEEESGDFGVGTFGLTLNNLRTGGRYYVRAYAHNFYGYYYGEEIIALASDTVNILYPSSDYSKGIRFDTSPDGGYPKVLSGTIPHYILVRSPDAVWYSSAYFGYISGVGCYERHYYNTNMYTDLYGLTNPIIRDEGVIKIKWKARIMKNIYPYGEYQRHLRTHGTTYDGVKSSIDFSDPWICEIFYTNPNTGEAWTIDELDDLIAGASIGEAASFGLAFLDFFSIYAIWANAEVRTDPATPIDDTSVYLNGTVIEDEAEDCEVWFEWGETDAYEHGATAHQTKNRGDSFTQYIEGLTPGATYHVRTVILTACGETFYGTDRTFPYLSFPGIWLGTGPTDRYLMEITDHVLGYRTEQGRDEELGHAASGIAELTCDNWDGRFSPEKTDGAYYGFLYIGAYLTIIEEYGGVLYFRFSGKIDKISPHPEPDNRVGYIAAIDGMDDLAGSEIETVLRTDTDEQELMGDILDAAGWLAGMRDLGAGVDTLQLGWFHEEFALPATQSLEDATRGFFFVDPEGYATWQNRHYRVTGDRLVSQCTFNENPIEVGYEWSKRDVKNWTRVTGYKYVDPYYGLPEEEWLWYAPTNGEAAPFIPANKTLTIWAALQGPRKSSDALVKGTHWNANSEYDKSGDDLSDNITVTPTYYGQAIKFVIENSGDFGAYLVVPDSPPAGAPDDGTLLVYGTIYEELVMTVVEEDEPSQTDYGKRTLSIAARFKSNYNDILSYAQWLIARYKDPLPSPIRIKVNPWYDYPDDTMKLYTLTLKISDRVTVISSHLGISQDYFIDKIIHEYVVNEGSWVETTEYWLSRCEGQSEGLYWILGVEGFSEVGETTRLGF